MKTEKSTRARHTDVNRMSEASRKAFDEKMARAKEAVQVEGLAELIAEVRAARKQQD